MSRYPAFQLLPGGAGQSLYGAGSSSELVFFDIFVFA